MHDIMHWHSDILSYIIAYIPILPEIWSGWILPALPGVCPIAFPVLSAIKRCPVRSAAFCYSAPIADSCQRPAHPPAGAARGFECKIGSEYVYCSNGHVKVELLTSCTACAPAAIGAGQFVANDSPSL